MSPKLDKNYKNKSNMSVINTIWTHNSKKIPTFQQVITHVGHTFNSKNMRNIHKNSENTGKYHEIMEK